MTVAEAIRTATERLATISDTARLDAELLMAHALGTTRSELLLRQMQAAAPENFAALIERRAAHEPVAYLLGQQEFWGLTLGITPGVLIPRGDSECVVEAALAARPEARRVLDLGTGSGALLLALLSELPEAAGVGIERSPQAGMVAAANVSDLGFAGRGQIVGFDWHRPDQMAQLGQFDLIVANPPYVETAAQLDPQVRDYEPAEALFAGTDGLDEYRILIPQLRALLNPGGVAVFEVGHRQGDAVAALAQSHGFTTEIRNDLANRQRCVILR
jgi:release factor glutamine methyltransferase